MTSTLTPTRILDARGLAILLLAYTPVNIMFGSFNVLAADIGTDLGASAAGQQLVLSSYTATFAASLLIAGRIGDRYGRRKVLVAGSLGVVVLGAASAFAPDLTTLVVLRVLTGIAAGLLTPQVLATIQTTAVEPLRRTGVMLFATVSGVATVLGQILAGVLASAGNEHLGWRLVQIVTALVALAGLLGLRAVPESRSSEPMPMDLRGAVLIGASLLLVVVPLTLGPSVDWDVRTLLALAAGVVGLVVFWICQIRSEARGVTPVVPPSVLRIRIVRRGLLMGLLFFATYGAFLYELSALAQARFDLGALGASLLVLGFGLAFIAASVALPRWLPLAGARTMTVAALVQAATLAAVSLLGFTGHADFWPLEIVLTVLGAAQALMYAPLLHTVLSRSPSWAAGVASGLYSTVQQLGLSLGVAVFGGVFWMIAEAGGSPATSSSLDSALGWMFAVHALAAVVFAWMARSMEKEG